jgi:fucose 4-O-acetylase-like acetyltransferase
MDRRIERNKISRQKVLVFLLALSLTIAISYIIFDKLEEIKREEHINIYQQGFQNGYTTAVVQLFQQVSTCQSVPLRVGNQTISVYSVECIFQQALNCGSIPVTLGNQTLNLVAIECFQKTSESQ